jgi:hypothetical protein
MRVTPVTRVVTFVLHVIGYRNLSHAGGNFPARLVHGIAGAERAILAMTCGARCNASNTERREV